MQNDRQEAERTDTVVDEAQQQGTDMTARYKNLATTKMPTISARKPDSSRILPIV